MLTGFLVGLLSALRAPRRREFRSAEAASEIHQGFVVPAFATRSWSRKWPAHSRCSDCRTLRSQSARSSDVRSGIRARSRFERNDGSAPDRLRRVRAKRSTANSSLAYAHCLACNPSALLPTCRWVVCLQQARFRRGPSDPAGQHAPSVLSNSVDPAYFETMRITILRGRTFTDADNDTAPRVAIMNQTMAHASGRTKTPLASVSDGW